jgi:hypothetical protein
MRKRTFLAGLPIYVAALAAQFVPQAQAASIASARQQQAPLQQPVPPQVQNPTPATHKVKVWTNEDLIATRTPADIYMFEKEAKTVASEMAAFKEVASCFAFDQPEGTIEETQKAIADTLQSIHDSEEAVAQARTAVATAPENLRARNQMELDRRISELQNSLAQLRALQNHLRQLASQPAGSISPASPAPEPLPAQ